MARKALNFREAIIHRYEFQFHMQKLRILKSMLRYKEKAIKKLTPIKSRRH